MEKEGDWRLKFLPQGGGGIQTSLLVESAPNSPPGMGGGGLGVTFHRCIVHNGHVIFEINEMGVQLN